jgi:anaerobic magnesium-protoporphyrin IX monomethyl ester cyclase
MKVLLIYPPPWKIVGNGEPPVPLGEGAPAEFIEGDLDADFFQTPYGLFTLASEAMTRGHQVKVVNLSSYRWSEVCEILRKLPADVYGMSCWTANRRGVAYTAEFLRQEFPSAHVVIGGPHATPFAVEMLEHYPAIDTVSLGESEETFLELLEALEAGRPTGGISGTAYRAEGEVHLAPSRASIQKIDTLCPPHRHFSTHILMTSRGCPWQCTFCGAETSWGRGFRGHSVGYVVDALESALRRLPVRMIQIKDDTFTANKKRALAICHEIQRRKLQFLWSCDTRVDVLDQELLLQMRRAGCERLSLGVESGSDVILQNIDKKITSDEIIDAANMAKAVGIQVRFYMMLGNRGETVETFQETLRFLERAKPHQYVFSCLSVYPGTRDFQEAVRQGWLNPELFFQEDFQEFKTPFDADEATTRVLSDWFRQHRGIQFYFEEDVAEARSILEKVGDYPAAHMDVAGASYRAGLYAEAEVHARRALELGYPAPGLAYNYLACVAYHRQDIEGMKAAFLEAARTDPQHYVLIENVERARAWFKEQGAERGLPLELKARHGFQLLERTLQPTLPGPLAEEFFEWTEAPLVVPSHLPSRSEVTLEGHEKQGFPERRLRVLS